MDWNIEEANYLTVNSNFNEENQNVIQESFTQSNTTQVDTQETQSDRKLIVDEAGCDEYLQELSQMIPYYQQGEVIKWEDENKTRNNLTQQTLIQFKSLREVMMNYPFCNEGKTEEEINDQEIVFSTTSEYVNQRQGIIEDEKLKSKRKDYGKEVSLVIMLLKIWMDFRTNIKRNSKGKFKKFTAEEASEELGLQNKTMEYYRLQLNKAVALENEIDITHYLNKSFGELNSQVERLVRGMSGKEAKTLKAKYKDPKVKRAFMKLLNDLA